MIYSKDEVAVNTDKTVSPIKTVEVEELDKTDDHFNVTSDIDDTAMYLKERKGNKQYW